MCTRFAPPSPCVLRALRHRRVLPRLIELPHNLQWLAGAAGSVPQPTYHHRHTLSPPCGKAIPATYINELVVNFATYERRRTRDSRHVLRRARVILWGFYYIRERANVYARIFYIYACV